MLRHRIWPHAAALAGVALLPIATLRADDAWELLGSRRVSFAAERDVIEVGIREGMYTAMRIEVVGGILDMYNIRLTFGNGDTWSPDFRVDHDAVVAVGRGAFRSLRIDVEGGDLEMFGVKVTFGNGETFSPATRVYFREGTRSRVIDLPGAARIIRRIDFFYRSAVFGGQGGAGGRATVHMYGRR